MAAAVSALPGRDAQRTGECVKPTPARTETTRRPERQATHADSLPPAAIEAVPPMPRAGRKWLLRASIP